MLTWSLWLRSLDPFAVRFLDWHQKRDKSAVCALVKLRFSSVGQLWAFAQCGPRDCLRDFCSQRPAFTVKAPLFYFIHEEEKKLENEVSRLHCQSKRCPEMRQTDFARVVLRNERWTYFMHLDEGHLLLQHSLKSSASWIKDARQNLLRRRPISSRTHLWMMFGDLVSEGELWLAGTSPAHQGPLNNHLTTVFKSRCLHIHPFSHLRSKYTWQCSVCQVDLGLATSSPPLSLFPVLIAPLESQRGLYVRFYLQRRTGGKLNEAWTWEQPHLSFSRGMLGAH